MAAAGNRGRPPVQGIIRFSPPPNPVHPLLRIVRGLNTAVSFAGTVVGGIDVVRISGLTVSSFWVPVLLAAGSTACVTAAGNILNDLRDLESDRRNHPNRPLVTGELTPASARTVMTVLFVASLFLILPIAFARWELLVIWAAAIGALLAYELRLKAEGLSGNAMVAFLTAGVFLYGAAAVGNPLVVAPFALMAFFATLSREVIKDMEDADGDFDRRTLPRTSGMAAAAGVARVCAVVAILLSPIPVLGAISATSVGGIIYLSLVATTDALFVVSVASLPHQLHRAQSISKGAMTVALAAFVAFAIR